MSKWMKFAIYATCASAVWLACLYLGLQLPLDR